MGAPNDFRNVAEFTYMGLTPSTLYFNCPRLCLIFVFFSSGSPGIRNSQACAEDQDMHQT
ncbi:hypothetical protein NC652_025969 [Populus alba x Populus x berolinensis]|nr:hypothetical protein NC652_025969 [Populus alba x Populus x berolinensis]